jgi:hypothetical protein
VHFYNLFEKRTTLLLKKIQQQSLFSLPTTVQWTGFSAIFEYSKIYPVAKHSAFEHALCYKVKASTFVVYK